MNPSFSVIVLLAAILLLAAITWLYRRGRRQRAMHLLLDAADALETRLRAARTEIESVAGDLHEDPVQGAMREMLRQRLWLREHGQQAPVAELRQVRASIDAAGKRIEQQLRRIRHAREPGPCRD